jgi:glycosyltransferase involved in cell wall biosynthesis
MSIVIIGDAFTFPEGTAATNRVHTYAKGFSENGVNVHVICFDSRYDTPGDGISNGIFYYHPFGQGKRNKYLLARSWRKVLKDYKTFRLITQINRNDKVIACLCYTKLLRTQFFVFVIAKYIKSKLVLERSEHPLQNYKDYFFTRILGRLKTFWETKLCNAILCISQYLIDFYKLNGVSSESLLLVPSTVDTNRFNIVCDPPLSYSYILYCGSITIIKDGVDILIKSFSKIAPVYPQVSLVILGKGDTIEEEIIVRGLVDSLNLNDRIFFLGQLPRIEVPPFMLHAKMLVLSRPKSMIADAGFPSKLTEYLASGRPIVVTKVGEIEVYLKDNETAFLSIPNSIDAFAERMDNILSDYESALRVGEKGKELTLGIFNYNVQAQRMIQFIYKLD